MARLIQRAILRVLGPADGLMNRLYGWRYNPLYHTGTIVVALLAIVILTGVYLLFFYKISQPYASVERLAAQTWLGAWIRSLHRYASDGLVAGTAIHAVRVFAQGRTWGPRALAWISGFVLLFLIFVCGWTGYVMVWDTQGLVLAREGARFLDALPLFSEPIGRTFVGDRPIPNAFFFLNLFLHVALPVGLAVLLWVHVSRAARPALLPPKQLTWTFTGVLIVASVLFPAALGREADLFQLPGPAPFDMWYAFWLPLTQAVAIGPAWIAVILLSGAALTAPWWAKPRDRRRLQPSVVDTHLCDGCRQCYLDCPYEAIEMVPLDGSRAGIVARVDPSMCVSCGICAGSCAPMGVGPPTRTGRDQLEDVRRFIDAHALGPGQMVVVACTRGAGRLGEQREVDGAPVFPVDCAGTAHTSVIEFLVRTGVSGVLVASCPPRDCTNREGPAWLEQRLYHGREAELQDRVDRRRVRLVYAGLGDGRVVRAALAAYRREVDALGPAIGERDITIDTSCDPVDTPEMVP